MSHERATMHEMTELPSDELTVLCVKDANSCEALLPAKAAPVDALA